ncbi:MAG: transposase [bacterium LCO1.1]|uniref:Transposase n=1 Tax=Candidatus Weimeria bifida TaxID=2599074 RepID=A0A6N7IWS7_9FIRM|nr:transposase [Candidatus Weimeria bifida]
MKALLYEGNGWLMCYKRFTNGKLQWPRTPAEAKVISQRQYEWLMEGLISIRKKLFQMLLQGFTEQDLTIFMHLKTYISRCLKRCIYADFRLFL